MKAHQFGWNVKKNVNYTEFGYFPGRMKRLSNSFDLLSRAHDAFIRSVLLFTWPKSDTLLHLWAGTSFQDFKLSGLSFWKMQTSRTCQQKKGMLINLRAHQINGLKTT